MAINPSINRYNDIQKSIKTLKTMLSNLDPASSIQMTVQSGKYTTRIQTTSNMGEILAAMIRSQEEDAKLNLSLINADYKELQKFMSEVKPDGK